MTDVDHAIGRILFFQTLSKMVRGQPVLRAIVREVLERVHAGEPVRQELLSPVTQQLLTQLPPGLNFEMPVTLEQDGKYTPAGTILIEHNAVSYDSSRVFSQPDQKDSIVVDSGHRRRQGNGGMGVVWKVGRLTGQRVG